MRIEIKQCEKSLGMFRGLFIGLASENKLLWYPGYY